MTKDYIENNLIGKTGKIKGKLVKKYDLNEENIYLIYFNVKKPNCYCGNNLKFLSFSKGYKKYCSSNCWNHSEENKRQASHNKLNMTIEKKKEVTDKIKQTKLERYGNKNYNNSEKAKITSKNNNSYYTRRLNMIKTNLELYGVKYSNNTKKASKTSIERYGNVFPIYENTIEKRKMTQIKRYGSMAWHTKEVIDKKRKNNKIDKSDYNLYLLEVWRYTRNEDLHTLKNIENRGRFTFHLDHKYSISEGFKNNILPHIIGNINNLEMLQWKKNISKGAKCSITIDELIQKV